VRDAVVLRAVVASDLPVLFAHQQDEIAVEMAGVAARELPAFLTHWGKVLADRDAVTRAIVAAGQVAGFIGVWGPEVQREVGFFLGRDYWNRGIATAALGLMLRDVSSRPLHARLLASNRGSLRVLESHGFERLRDANTLGDPATALAELTLILRPAAYTTLDITRIAPTAASAQWCLEQYFAEIDRRFEHGFDRTRSPDPPEANLLPPNGAFLIAHLEDVPVGCVELSGDGSGVAEVKRLWVAPLARGRGVARRLMQAVDREARALRVHTLRLDTNAALPEAVALYRGLGWTEIAPYGTNPYAHHFFEKRIEET
jgi:RimJ/RimL family protein N-acetyltransferase